MENIEVTVRFGVGNGRIISVASGTTIGQVIDNPETKASLGYPNNVRALINRVEQSRNTRLVNRDIVDLETVGTSKAS